MHMRKIFVLAGLCFLLQTGYGQQTDSLKRQQVELYKKRRNTYNTVGWILLGTGLTLSMYSYFQYEKNGFNGTWELEPLFFVGGGMAIASIPFFILARHNKVKARLALKAERVLPTTMFLKPDYPAISLQLHW